jgi:hypothetical protein
MRVPASQSPTRGRARLRTTDHHATKRPHSGVARARRSTFTLCALLAGALLVFPAVSSADSCPNATYRTGPSSRLPDCRAYELVTPPYKEGFPVYDRGFSEDGSSVWGESLGVFAGSEDSEIGGSPSLGYDYLLTGGAYAFVREASGWSTVPISPPVSQYPSSLPFTSITATRDHVSFSADLASSLWVAVTPAQEAAAEMEGVALSTVAGIYLRTANGPLAEVGPLLPPSVDPREVPRENGESLFYKLDGASSDLSRVFYSMTDERWPGDATELGKASLYEYIGTGSPAPLLVGVAGGAGSTSLISRCGTGFEGVSESGEDVLFAASSCGSAPAVQELYERVDNEQSDAHTVAISEPSPEDCAECDTEPTVRRTAAAVSAQEGIDQTTRPSGLSEDGARVFFATSQPLLGGDTSENLYEYDAQNEAGRRIVRISGGDATVHDPVAGVERAVSISPDGSHVYFLAAGVLTTTPNSVGERAEAGHSNLYLYERDAQYPGGRTVFVLPAGSAEISSVSQNGQFVAFSSDDHFTSDDLSSVAQEFEYNSQTGGFVRVSIGQNGFNDDGNTGTVGSAVVVDDGAVVFVSANPLVPSAVNGLNNIYEYREGNVNLITDGQEIREPGGFLLGYVSPTGDDVFLNTFDQLVPRDGDSQEDTYDARVDGGFSEPPPPPSCTEDACQGPLSSSPVLLAPGSEFQAGGENPAGTPPAGAAPAPKSKSKKQGKKTRRKKPKHSREHSTRKAGKSSSDSRRRVDRIGGRP